MKQKRILVADDDRLILATLARGLRDAGYDVVEADNGRAALELCLAESTDLAVLDLRMPEMTGVEVARALRVETEIPFLFLSAYNDADVVREAAEEGALGYLVKPVDVPQLVPSIEAALARAEDIRKLKDSEFHLNRALAERRETSVAVGLIMERHRLTEGEAFELLRRRARSDRRRLSDVADEVVKAAEVVNLQGKEAQMPGPRPGGNAGPREAVRRKGASDK